MNAGKPFGGVLAAHLGLKNAPSLIARSARRERLEISRITIGPGDVRDHGIMAPEDSFIILLPLAEYRHPEIWRRRNRPILAPEGYYPKGSVTIVTLMEGVSMLPAATLDALCLYLPRASLDAFIDEVEGLPIQTLSCVPAIDDPVLAHLGAVLLPLLARPHEANAVFVDQVGQAVLAHLAVTYGGLRLPLGSMRGRVVRGLSAGQEARAKEMLLAAPLEKALTMDVAAACRMSRSHFIRSFKATTGRTPHRWLLEQRVEQAKRLLRGPLPIADIALDCGFSDQSHLSRVFKSFTGVPPGLWRRLSRETVE